MPSIEVKQISKTFGKNIALDDVSFSVEPGEIFGLLGPNGAGKTTCIRIILDIMKADKGSISILGSAMNETKKNKIGYLPEERGLYQDISLDNCLSYLASLKNLDATTARHRIDEFLTKFDLAEHRKKKLKELSKGMQQKAQLIATLVHDPDIIIIDEPFSALDPVNTQMVKDLLEEQRKLGKTVVMCTHQMHQVEELCDRLVLIDKGKVMLYGELSTIRKQYAGHDIRIRTSSQLPAAMDGIESMEKENGGYLLKPAKGSTSQSMLRSLVEHNITLEQFEIATPTLDDIFIQVVTGSGEGS